MPRDLEYRARIPGRFRFGIGLLLLAIGGCAPGPMTRLEPPPHAYLQEGAASWYGRKFAGRRTASGEIFDPQRLTAASPTLPLGAVVRLTNLKNGRQVLVRINDRGPYSGGRILDCSESAARELGFRRHGTTRIAVEWPPREAAVRAERQALWLEVGVFESTLRARAFRARILSYVESVDLRSEASWVRVLAGPYDSRERAEGALARVREAGFPAALVLGEIPPTAERTP